MTKEQKIEAFTMLLDGCTYQEVADAFNVSRQRINQIFKNAIGGRGNGDPPERFVNGCVFPNLAEAILKNNFTARKLFAALYDAPPEETDMKSLAYHCTLLKRRLVGQTPFTSAEWLKLGQIFSIPLEKLMDSDGAIKCVWRRKAQKSEQEALRI